MVLGVKVRRKRIALHSNEEATGLLSGNMADDKRHHRLAAATYFFTVFACLAGMSNTFLRTGRLFPGPHLFSGLGIILAGSFNIALVPWFKDHPFARLPHSIVGFIIILLLGVQVKSGLPILRSLWRSFH